MPGGTATCENVVQLPLVKGTLSFSVASGAQDSGKPLEALGFLRAVVLSVVPNHQQHHLET